MIDREGASSNVLSEPSCNLSPSVPIQFANSLCNGILIIKPDSDQQITSEAVRRCAWTLLRLLHFSAYA